MSRKFKDFNKFFWGQKWITKLGLSIFDLTTFGLFQTNNIPFLLIFGIFTYPSVCFRPILSGIYRLWILKNRSERVANSLRNQKRSETAQNVVKSVKNGLRYILKHLKNVHGHSYGTVERSPVSLKTSLSRTRMKGPPRVVHKWTFHWVLVYFDTKKKI